MDALSESGEVLCFWLTQRLCRELVKGFVDYFATADLARSSADPHHVAVVQGYLQQQAKENKKPARPIDRKPDVTSLVAKLQLRTSPKAIAITLPLPNGNDSVLAFKPAEARQWLDILYQQYCVAEWPLSIWPAWIKSEPATPVTEQKQPLH